MTTEHTTYSQTVSLITLARAILAVVVAIFIMGGVFIYLQSQSMAMNGEGIKCLVGQQLEHRYANRSAHTALAEHDGVTYDVPPDALPSSREDIQAIADQIEDTCTHYLGK